jgi:hypothetical protein
VIEPENSAEASWSQRALDVLGLRWRSGKFIAMAGESSFGLHLDAGRVILATSTQRSLRLGHLLLQIGAVRPSFLEEVLEGVRSIERTQALGSVLVREGAVTRADLAAGVEEQCIEVLSRMMDVANATFLHVSDEPLPRDLEIVPLDTERLLRAAMIRSDQRAAIKAMRQLLPDPHEALIPTSPMLHWPHALTADELIVANAIERGTNRLSDLCLRLRLDPLNVKRAVIGLLERGFITRSGRPDQP